MSNNFSRFFAFFILFYAVFAPIFILFRPNARNCGFNVSKAQDIDSKHNFVRLNRSLKRPRIGIKFSYTL